MENRNKCIKAEGVYLSFYTFSRPCLVKPRYRLSEKFYFPTASLCVFLGLRLLLKALLGNDRALMRALAD